MGGHICICVPVKASELCLSPPSPAPLPFCSIPRDTRLPCACRWLMELPAQWCQEGPEHLQHLTLTWNSKFVCSRNFWFMVSANLLIALRKTLEGETRLLHHSCLRSFSSSQLKFPHPLPRGKIGLQTRTLQVNTGAAAALLELNTCLFDFFRNLSCLTFNPLKAHD